ncbi:MAG: helix-turn-helix domain-containing protein [Bacteroidota bacterium]
MHLSKKEEIAIEGIFENIATEYFQPIDKYSKSVLLSNIDLLLTYANRFYNRQFITRNEVDSSLVRRFEQELKEYVRRGLLLEKGIPSVRYFAEKLNLSANYLSDMLKSITGKTTKEHIHYQLIEQAKNKLISTDMSVAEIAFELGFEYPQYFTRLFKLKTGVTPSVYKRSANDTLG